MQARVDVVVVGTGPAGLAAATACAERGLTVTVLAEDHDARWPQTLGIWADELDGLGLADVLADRWPAVTVHLGETRARRVGRAYGRIDNTALQRTLADRLELAGGRRATGRAVGAVHDPAGTTVVTETGARLACRVAVDASGHRPALLAAGRGRPAAVQTAYGLVGRVTPTPIAAATMLLMDYREPSGAHTGPDCPQPTFLYGMAFDDGRCLLEETSLAGRPPLPLATLESRLRRRLDTMGVRVEQRIAVERVSIPMGGPLPPRSQRVVGFGAAAGMVHPATGYQLGAALSRAPRLGAALAHALDHPGAQPRTVSAAGWAAVWPDDLVRQRALHTLGLESLLRLGSAQTRAFFRAFFDLAPQRWSGFLSGERSAAQLAATMLVLFARAPADVRRTLAAAAVRNPRMLGAVVARPRTAAPRSGPRRTADDATARLG